MRTQKIGFLSLLILVMLVNVFNQAVHETGHRIVYQIMGRDPVWGFTNMVQLWEATPTNPDEWVEAASDDGARGWLKLSSPIASKTEDIVSTAAGPLAGLLGAVLGLAITRKSKSAAFKQIGLVIALNAAFVATLYYARSPFRASGDESHLAMLLGVPKSAIELPLAFSFALCLILGLRQLLEWTARLKWFGILFLGSVATGLPMALSDGWVTA